MKQGWWLFKEKNSFESHGNVYGKSTEAVTRSVLYNGVLKNLAKLTGKHLCLSLFFNKVAGLMAATIIKKRL